jgi:hypothetical protein
LLALVIHHEKCSVSKEKTFGRFVKIKVEIAGVFRIRGEGLPIKINRNGLNNQKNRQ